MTQKYQSIKYLHQIHLSKNVSSVKDITNVFHQNIESAKNLYSEAEYKIWSEENIYSFLNQYFKDDVLLAYNNLDSCCDKSYLVCYCLMYIYGGIYFDCSLRFLDFWRIPFSQKIAACKDNFLGHKSWTCIEPSLLWSVPHRGEWKYAIDWLVKNYKFVNNTKEKVAGEVLLGYAFASVLAKRAKNHDNLEDQFVGETPYITPETDRKNKTFIDQNKRVIAIQCDTVL